MKIGAVYEGDATLYKVEIENRGGDSARDEYFEKSGSAVFASAIDGQNRLPTPVTVMKFSDGTLVERYESIRVSRPPSKEDIYKLKEKLSPALRLLLNQKL